MLLVLSLAAAFAVWRVILSDKNSTVEDQHVYVENGVDGSPAVVPLDKYREYKAGLEELNELRKRKKSLLKEKERVFGDLSEERRVEMLLQKANNRIIALSEKLKAFEQPPPGK